MNAEGDEKDKRYHGYEVLTTLPHFNPIEAILLAIRIVPVAAITCVVILFQEYIRPHVHGE